MFVRPIREFGARSRLIVSSAIFATHTATCPTKRVPGSGNKAPTGAGSGKGPPLKRATYSGKVRLALFPEEWFLFFHSKTGVSGPYVFGLVLTNYLVSKEIYVMEHEYYLGLSIFVLLALVTKYLGKDIAAGLDKQVDDVINNYESVRKAEKQGFEDTVKLSKDAIWRAEGQKLLMDAKKENIQMQLEAIYRERMMAVYSTVKGRMDYHRKRYQSEARIQQRWMIKWVLENVMKSVTPEFEQQALNRAIKDLAEVAGRVK